LAISTFKFKRDYCQCQTYSLFSGPVGRIQRFDFNEIEFQSFVGEKAYLSPQATENLLETKSHH